MNFRAELEKGQAGGNKGLPMGDGLKVVSRKINGVQKARIFGIAGAPKSGKSTFVDAGFVIGPYLHALENPEVEVEFIYFSYEIDRVSKEFDFVVHFLYNDYNISKVKLGTKMVDGVEKQITVEGKTVLALSPDYLRGRVLDDDEETILLDPKLLPKIKEVFQDRIIPLFGRYDADGNLVPFMFRGKEHKKGMMTFVVVKDNPTGLYKYLQKHASKHGKLIRKKFGSAMRVVGYKPNNPDKYTIVVTDHLRKLVLERGWPLKQVVDKYIEYSVELRNWLDYTFVHIIHLNRSMTETQRLKEFGEYLFPTSDDIKDTGNLSEDADYVFTMFAPNDTRYNLRKHFGTVIKDKGNNPIYEYLRTIHLVENRHGPYPQHCQVNMMGHLKTFKPFIENGGNKKGTTAEN